MKQYPSIPRSTGTKFREFEAYVFDKLDGSNLRFEWSRKRGWYKYGTRHRLFDQSDPDFGVAISLFQESHGSQIARVAKKEGWDQIVAFAEFYGDRSFAGLHEPDDPKKLALFDVAVHKKGLLGPRDFIKLFGDLPTPKFLGRYNWTRGFVEMIRTNPTSEITFEGAVGKMMDGRKLIMAKAKTQAWIDKVKARYGAEAEKILQS
jgi:hypothetical protein